MVRLILGVGQTKLIMKNFVVIIIIGLIAVAVSILYANNRKTDHYLVIEQYATELAKIEISENQGRYILFGERLPGDDLFAKTLKFEFNVTVQGLTMHPKVYWQNKRFADGYNMEVKKLLTDKYGSERVKAVFSILSNPARRQ